MAKFVDGLRTTPTTVSTDKFCDAHGIRLEFYHLPSKDSVSFKGYITQYVENYNVDFNTEEVYGRLDPIAIYKGTVRVIQLGWVLVAETEAEAYENLRKAQKYIQMMYPSYKNFKYGTRNTKKFSASTLSTPPLLKMKFMNLIAKYDSRGDGFNLARQDVKRNYNLDGKQSLNTKQTNLTKQMTLDYNVKGAARDDGLLVIPGNLTFDPKIPDKGALIKAQAAVPFEIEMSSQYTVLHEHDLGTTKNFTKQYGKDFSAGQLSQIKALQKDIKKYEYRVDQAKKLSDKEKGKGYIQKRVSTENLTDLQFELARRKEALKKKKKEPKKKKVLRKIIESDALTSFDKFPFGTKPANRQK